MQELNKVLEDWIDGKIRTVMSPLLNASVTHEDQIHKLEEDSHFAFCDIQRIETRLDRLEAFVFSDIKKTETRLDKLEAVALKCRRVIFIEGETDPATLILV